MSQVSLCLHICRERVWKGTANNGYLGSGWGYGKCFAILYAWLAVPVVCVCACVLKWPLWRMSYNGYSTQDTAIVLRKKQARQ